MADEFGLASIGPDPLFPTQGNFYVSSDGYRFTDAIGGPFVRNWLKENFTAEPSDVYVVSFPKTGTTWAQEIIYLIANDIHLEKCNREPLATRFPIMELKAAIDDGRIASLSQPRFIKTHLPYSLLPKSIYENNCKIIYTIRNPKDTVVSYFHFIRAHKYLFYRGEWENFFEHFIENTLPYSPYWKHIMEIWERRAQENILILFYEDMQKDLASQVTKVASFLGKSLTQQQVAKIVDHCQFKNMKNNPNTNYVRELMKEGFQFMRKGEVGDWKNFLTPKMNAAMDNYCENYFKNSGLEFTFEI